MTRPQAVRIDFDAQAGFVHVEACLPFEGVRAGGYVFQIEMTYRAIRKGMRVKEVPIIFVDRTAGASKMSRKIFLEAIGVVWRLRGEAVVGKL